MNVRLEQWTDEDLALLHRSNTEQMAVFLGGPDLEEKILDRHARYLRYWFDDPQTAWTFRIVIDDSGDPEAVGGVAYWQTEPGEWEIGWSVISAMQGRGVATAAVLAAIEDARARGHRGVLHATPSVDNGPSNGVARKSGFRLASEVDIEYPPGRPMRANDWVLDL